ncbi:MAG: phosphohydrolase [Candidatus Omnitrophica bacterium CG11_big_fil_rev_8_21_14_0_20_64_10]|nr:MAG: phosphohydrolase [Candidatus Omnitrophica bacterium CG11_big_fil_rev_8_21_14_0_20_64_10]
MKIPTSAKYKTALTVLRRLRNAGHKAFLVGGCVRDMVMERVPKDFDIATSARPDAVRRLFPKTVAVGAQFGVILVVSGSHTFEVATFRSDQGYRDGRHPTGVTFSTPRQDALRRDFTINGLFWDPGTRRVIDYVGGRADIQRRLLRTIGKPEERFKEDRLRVLRAVRFSAVLGFAIHPDTLAAVKRFASKLTGVSAERIREELVKLLSGPDPGRGLELLDATGLLPAILPEVEKMKGVPQPPEFHPEGDVFVHTVLVLKQLKRPSPVLGLAALLHDIGKPPTFKVAERIRFDGHDQVGAGMARTVCRRLRFSNAETDAVCEIVRNHMKFKDVRQMRVATLKRFMAEGTFAEQLKMHRADCMGSHKDLSNWEFLREKLKEFSQEEIHPAPLITGHDLIGLGYKPGPRMGEILRAVQEQQLEQKLTDRDGALAWVEQQFPKTP